MDRAQLMGIRNKLVISKVPLLTASKFSGHVCIFPCADRQISDVYSLPHLYISPAGLAVKNPKFGL
jgi:hypothetical protein